LTVPTAQGPEVIEYGLDGFTVALKKVNNPPSRRSAPVEADGPDFYEVTGVESWDVLNMRAEAQAQAPQIGAVPAHGTCIRNLGCVGGLTLEEFTSRSASAKRDIERQRPRWCRIAYHSIEGWVAGRYLRESTHTCTREP
jgi:hypothetical protein